MRVKDRWTETAYKERSRSSAGNGVGAGSLTVHLAFTVWFINLTVKKDL